MNAKSKVSSRKRAEQSSLGQPFCFSLIVNIGNWSEEEPKLLEKLLEFDVWFEVELAEEAPNEIMTVQSGPKESIYREHNKRGGER